MRLLLWAAATAALLLQEQTTLGVVTLSTSHYDSTERGSFQNPSARVRTKFRYWVPDASVASATIREDIAAVASIGGGGVELLPFYNYGDITPGFIPTDWTKYGWGTPAWRELQDAAIQATKDNNLVIDLALGPNQGAGVPAPENAVGLQWDLQPFNITVPLGGSFNGTLPGWGTGALVAATTGLVSSTTNSSTARIYTLATESLQDVTRDVAEAGGIHVSFPTNQTGEHDVLFAYYLVHTQYREQRSPLTVRSGEGVEQSPVTSFVQNGSWVVDHFSTRGAEQVKEFWEGYLLNGSDTTQLLAEVGRYLWEDSQEFPSNILWTPQVPAVFLKQHGYAVSKYLPILMHGNGGGVSNGVAGEGFPDPDDFVLDAVDEGRNLVADFRQTMTDLNKQYLKGLTDFAASLGLGSNTQVGYNLPVDMLSAIPFVSAPETESLGFDALDGAGIDGYLQFSGPADLAGKKVISLEAGSVFYTTYQQTIPEQLYYLNRAAVGGINSFKLHGMPFSGYYPNTTWPGYTPFSYVASEMHGQRQPGWEDYREWMDYSSRLQWAMQHGVAKVDIAFWLKNESVSSTPIRARYLDDDLVRDGYTYEYLSPDNFELEEAYVEGGVLAPTQQGFKVLVMRKDETLTHFGAKKLLQFARAGLSVVFYGGVPENVLGRTTADESNEIKTMLSNITTLSNVHITANDGLARVLASIGIEPRLALDGDKDTWYSRWREDENEAIVLLYYDATGLPPNTPSTTKTLKFEGIGTPYVYDAWTGQQRRLSDYTQTSDSTTITLSLAGNQTTMIAFRKAEESTFHTTADLTTHSTQQPGKPLTLSNWILTLESWSAPANISNIAGTVRQNTTHHIGNDLLPWNHLKVSNNLTHIAGRGYYHSSFPWSVENGTSTVITMDPVLHIAVLYVNGHRLPPLDPTAPKADVSAYLRDGRNDVKIVVSSPLGNAMIPVADKLRSAGADLSLVNAALGMDLIKERENGLVGNVVVTAYGGRD